MWLASTCCTPLSASSLFVLLFVQMSSWYNLAGYGWYGSYGSWYGTSTWQLGWKVGSTLRCRVVLPEVGYWELVESYGLQTLCECRERRRGYPAVVNSGKIAVLEKTLAGMGDDELILAGKKVLEKELDKPQRKLNGPKKTAKHIEAKQNWINRESKRLEAETARLTELQESLRVGKEALKVAYEELKILREDLLREGESMDKNKSHFLSLENTKEIRRLEQQELAFWRGSASKRLAAGWTMEAQRLNKEVEAKNRKLQETIVRDSRKDARMEDAMGDLEGSLSS